MQEDPRKTKGWFSRRHPTNEQHLQAKQDRECREPGYNANGTPRPKQKWVNTPKSKESGYWKKTNPRA